MLGCAVATAGFALWAHSLSRNGEPEVDPGRTGIPKAKADQIADSISQGSSSSSAGFAEVAGHQAKQLYAAVQHDFALASRTVFYAMSGVMALAFVVSLATMPSGKVEDVVEEPGVAADPREQRLLRDAG